jgi:MFS family permease
VAPPGGDAPQPGGGFLPPEAAGPTPPLGGPPPPEAPTWTPPPQQPAPAWQPRPAWPPGPAEPDNNPAVIGFCLSVGSIGLLFLTGSFSTVLSLGLGIAGIITSRRGRRMVEEGETRKHKDLATAGFVVGIVATALSALASLFWIGIVVALIIDASSHHDSINDQDADPAVLGVVAVLRLAGVLLS